MAQAGTYGFRTIWENGGGDSNIEWFTVDYNGGTTNYTLINDVANGGYPAYRAVTGAAAPFVKTVLPQPVPRQVEGSSRNLVVVLADGTTPVDTNSISLKIDGNAATITKQRSGNLVTVDTGPAFKVDRQSKVLPTVAGIPTGQSTDFGGDSAVL